ncbi:MAG: tRNA (N(6)-L-threonylcarbamoyladenosine(37)-C(2))-methylthiotransferase MtaB [Clostridia bacterium]|nr:tRNA (N(6)-L-threonylcarbamoyladenosine(37)-C(2))-methylthiotransferase MtaB [Clostridia bacterium]
MKACFITLGCKVNQYESESIAKRLQNEGFEISFKLEEADVYVLSTCAVTNEAERKSRGLISKVLKLNPNAKIYICGCSSQHDKSKFIARQNVKLVVGTSSKMQIAESIIEDAVKQKENLDIEPFYEDIYSPLPSHTRAYIKIQDGCNRFCSYCLIPYLRGRSRSRSLESINAEIDNLATQSKEIIITGIDISAYGEDLENKKSLINVALLFKGKNVRFRFSSFEVRIINDEFLKTLKSLDNFCPHFHLSLQSGSDSVLKAMNRHYTTKEFLDKIKLIRKYFKDAAITTDIIIGFPTETDELFNETYNTCKKADFADMHIFPFSLRSGTAAEKLKNVATNVPERIKKLTELKNELKTSFIESQVGKEEEILIEGKVSQQGYYEGHSRNYIKCYIKNSKNISPNTIYSVIIKAPFKDGALAEVKSEE